MKSCPREKHTLLPWRLSRSQNRNRIFPKTSSLLSRIVWLFFIRGRNGIALGSKKVESWSKANPPPSDPPGQPGVAGCRSKVSPAAFTVSRPVRQMLGKSVTSPSLERPRSPANLPEFGLGQGRSVKAGHYNVYSQLVSRCSRYSETKRKRHVA